MAPPGSFPKKLTQNIGLTGPDVIKGCPVNFQHCAGRVQQPDKLEGLVKNSPELALACPQSLLCPFALGNIFTDKKSFFINHFNLPEDYLPQRAVLALHRQAAG
jgi:hypothetical protein